MEAEDQDQQRSATEGHAIEHSNMSVNTFMWVLVGPEFYVVMQMGSEK